MTASPDAPSPNAPSPGARLPRRALMARGAAGLTAAGLGTYTGHDLLPRPARDRSARPTSRQGAVGVQVIWRLSGAGHRTAVTFDDGPDPRWTPRVLDALAAQNAHATFFMIGAHAKRYPRLVRRVADAGHEIGNHTWSHQRIDQLNTRQVRTQLRRTHDTLADLIGRTPTLLRPPWGAIDVPGMLVASELGYRIVLWSDLIRGSDPGEDLRRLRSQVQPGAVILGHDGGPTPDERLMTTFGELIGRLGAAGHALTTVSVALAYSPDPTR